jgi:exopolyphosphatase/guanosine-5'-triphosphate,3'-diphosphate pyrophosphatase
MRQEDILTVIDQLVEMDYAARAANACIGRERADLVLAGCAIFEAIRRAFPSDRVRIADRGLREGILLRMMHEDRAWWRRRPA